MTIYPNVSVELVDISKKIGTRVLFEGLSNKVSPGECLAITGPNGSGKSTLLKMIAGLISATTGRIEVRSGERKMDMEERLSYIGLISPEVIFYIDMTGVENILFFTRLRGLQPSADKIKECLEVVGLASYKDNLVYTYSTGMRQRLKFALLLLMEPGLWLFDEPSSNLDADGKKLVSEIIRKGLEDQATIVIATNEAWEAEYAGCKIELA